MHSAPQYQQSPQQRAYSTQDYAPLTAYPTFTSQAAPQQYGQTSSAALQQQQTTSQQYATPSFPPSVNDYDLISDLESRHFSMCGILSARLAKVRNVRSVWSSKDPIPALQASLQTQDPSVIMDVIKLVTSLGLKNINVALGNALCQCLQLVFAVQPLPIPEAYVEI